MYKTTGGFPHTPKIPNQVLPPSPSPVYNTATTNMRPHINYGSFTAPFPTIIPLKSNIPSPDYHRPRRDSSSSRSHDAHTRMRANSGPSDNKPLRSILKRTVGSVMNTFRSSSRAEISKPSGVFLSSKGHEDKEVMDELTVVDYDRYAPIPFEVPTPSPTRGRTPAPAPVAVYHSMVAPSVPSSRAQSRSRSRDHSTTRSTEDNLKPHRSSSLKTDHPSSKQRSVASSDSGASSDYEIMKVHRKPHHHSRHHSSKSRSSATSSDSGHMSDSPTNFKVKAIYNRPGGNRGMSFPLTPNTRSTHSRLVDGYNDPIEIPLKPEAISLTWPLVGEVRHRGHVQACPLYFDVACEPWHSVSIWSATEKRAKSFFPLHREFPASAHTMLTEMTIVCDMMDMWPVTVVRKEGIRCIDIFDAIYKTYAMPLTEKEKVILGPDILLRSERAFRQRIRDSPGLPYVHERLGVLRVDTLLNYRIFGGLVQNGEEWKLILKDPRQ